MAKKPTYNEFIDDLGPERYFMDGELSREQAAKYWRKVYNQRYGTESLRMNNIRSSLGMQALLNRLNSNTSNTEQPSIASKGNNGG